MSGAAGATKQWQMCNQLCFQFLFIVDHNITEEETEALIANNTTSLFVGNVSRSIVAILRKTKMRFLRYFFQILEHEATERNKLRELRERHSELEKIERSITEVRDMFLRISTLVMEQVRRRETKSESQKQKQ